jgi:4-hydroxythreonine-4-phosphate dehydrogenase
MVKKRIIGITQGDPNGVGMEVILKCFQDNYLYNYCTPVVYATQKSVVFWKKQLEFNDPIFKVINSVEEAEEGQFNLIPCGNKDFKVEPGVASKEAGEEAFEALKACLDDAKQGKLDAIVTAPLDKSTVNPEGINFTGHTDYLASEFEVEDYLMLMTCEDVRVGLVTTHIPISEVSKVLTKDVILHKLEILNHSLRDDFGIAKPKIAVLGLNPHAGDKGVMGDEEKNIILPAIEEAISADIMAIGPYPSDGFFGSRGFKNFDGVLAMYHDQGLIPFKYISGQNGVNYTTGLTVVRTSPDHGTAYDIAGKGIAAPESMRTAIFEALDIVQQREETNELSKNPLTRKFIKRERFKMDF